jgi:sigma-B regulation protein RsbU (phosphoserine phosphatase)
MSMPQRRHSLSTEARVGLGAAVAALVVVTIAELFDGPTSSYVGWLAVAPYLAASFAHWRYVVGVGGLATLLAAISAITSPAGVTQGSVCAIGGMMAATGTAVVVSNFRQRQQQRYAELDRLAAIAQDAVIRPLDPQVGRLAVAGRYVSASAALDIGGDLYEVLDTPFGVRMIIGDVRGKGLESVRLANLVLGVYRHAAFERADLRDIVTDLDRAVARSVGDEEFVTAAIVEERGGTLTVVNCGHPVPLLLRRGQVIPLETPRTGQPLGLGSRPETRVQHLEPNDRLLLYTDGLSEARRSGEFFPTDERAVALLSHGTVEHGLASLESALVEWVHGRFEDDIAMLLMEYTGAAPASEPAVPSWEIGGTPATRS